MIRVNEKPEAIYVQMQSPVFLRDPNTSQVAFFQVGTQFKWLQVDVSTSGCSKCNGMNAARKVKYLIPNLILCTSQSGQAYWSQSEDASTGITDWVSGRDVDMTEVGVEHLHPQQPRGLASEDYMPIKIPIPKNSTPWK